MSIYFLFIWPVFQDISGLAVQFFADGVKGGEADSFGLACLKDGEVGGSDTDFISQLIGFHLSLGQHDI